MMSAKFVARLIASVLMVILVASCANSVVLGKVYDSFGSRTARQFKAHARFDQSQKQQIELFANAYHSWHRSTQLDLYAGFLRAMLAEVEQSDAISFDQSTVWWQSVRSFSDAMRSCNPFNASADLLAEMSDSQVRQMADHMRAELNAREEKYRGENKTQRLERRVKDMTKWSRRAGITFNDRQTALLRKTLGDQISLGAQRFELRRAWIESYILLLGQRSEPDFKRKISAHIDSVWRLTESQFADEWRHNEQLWTRFFADFINLQTTEQRTVFVARVNSIAATFEKLAKKKTEAEAVCYSN